MGGTNNTPLKELEAAYSLGNILAEVKMKRFGNLSFRYLKEPFIKMLRTSAPYG